MGLSLASVSRGDISGNQKTTLESRARRRRQRRGEILILSGHDLLARMSEGHENEAINFRRGEARREQAALHKFRFTRRHLIASALSGCAEPMSVAAEAD
jgi:hypothetical protein